ncbi:gliding motility protein GldL [Bacteroides sp. UBA939]|uniref:type IX secretion system motor protein PorL/GldL n=1 Tax=Bacteroides sp. UBA939 TaxID=1946092 RepID=UPI0025BDB553|nr:gliding motility protein GldL [Bacteroides sp. UBA939]
MERDTDNGKRGLGQKLQDFMASYRGKVIMNYAYSWGAAIVIAGTLCKLTHLPGANLMLWLGMGTEVLVFFISAFDLPDKQVGAAGVVGGVVGGGTGAVGGANAVGGVIVVGNGVIGATTGGLENNNPSLQSPQSARPSQSAQLTQPLQPAVTGAGNYPPVQPSPSAQSPVAGTGNYPPAGIITTGTVFPGTPSPAFTPEMEETTQAYITQLKEMTKMLSGFTAQAESLSHDAEQMSTLNRNLAGINAIYEMQLRSASTQIGTIDQVHEQTRKMVRQIEELNAVYARMIQAIQVK